MASSYTGRPQISLRAREAKHGRGPLAKATLAPAKSHGGLSAGAYLVAYETHAFTSFRLDDSGAVSARFDHFASLPSNGLSVARWAPRASGSGVSSHDTGTLGKAGRAWPPGVQVWTDRADQARRVARLAGAHRRFPFRSPSGAFGAAAFSKVAAADRRAKRAWGLRIRTHECRFPLAPFTSHPLPLCRWNGWSRAR